MTVRQLFSDVRKEIRWVGFGAFFFWLPDLTVHAFARNRFDTRHVWLVTVLCPLSLLIGYYVAAHFSARRITGLNSGLMILGMWCSGGIATMLASSFAGAAFATADGRLSAVIIFLFAVIFPPFTAMLATYDGTLGALLLGTALMGAEAATLSARLAQRRLWKAAG